MLLKFIEVLLENLWIFFVGVSDKRFSMLFLLLNESPMLDIDLNELVYLPPFLSLVIGESEFLVKLL